jgi:hypothetical protein
MVWVPCCERSLPQCGCSIFVGNFTVTVADTSTCGEPPLLHAAGDDADARCRVLALCELVDALAALACSAKHRFQVHLRK